MRVGFVCTNYNNSSYTRAAISSLHQGGRWDDVRAVVVDNKSRAEDIASLGQMAREFPGVELVLNSSNVGYFPGLNVGIRHLRSKYPDVEHIVVGNNDLVFPKDFVEAVQRHRDVFDTWAVVAPDLVTHDGVHQNPHVLHPIGAFRKLVWDLYYISPAFGTLIERIADLTHGFTRREETSGNGQMHATPGPIEQGYGACYMLGPVFFRHFTRLCAPTFMMQEEFFLYEQLKEIGQRTYYDPRFVVYHHGHATTDRLPPRTLHRISRDAHRVYKRYVAMSPEKQRRLIAAESQERGSK